MTKIESLSVDVIQLKLGTQMRAQVDDDTVEHYAELWKAKHEFPPLDVFHDGEQYVLADGFHRLYGAKQAKRASIPCRIHKGTVREAILFACGANHDHGLHRTNADKRCAIEKLLDDPEWGKRSMRWIAEQCKVHDRTVAKVVSDRKPSVLAKPTAQMRSSVECKDGKTRPAATTKKLPSQSDAPPTPAEDEPTERELIAAAIAKDIGALGEKYEEITPAISGGITFNTEEFAADARDAFGAEPPEELRPVFELCVGFDEQLGRLSLIKTWITQNENHPGAVVLASAASRLRADLKQATNELKFAKPYCVCVYCKNKKPKVATCTACKGLGWITEPIYKAAPKGMR